MAMIYTSEQTYAISPTYIDDLTRTIGALQHLQVLMAAWNDPTLADVAHLVGSMQQDFGPGESLDDMFQRLTWTEILLHGAYQVRDISQRWIVPSGHKHLEMLQGPDCARKVIDIGWSDGIGLLRGVYHRHHLTIHWDLQNPILYATRTNRVDTSMYFLSSLWLYTVNFAYS